MRAVAVVLAGAAAAWIALCTWLYVAQDQLVYFPQPARTLAPTLELVSGGMRLRVASREIPGAPAVLYFGGNAEDVSGALDGFATAFPGSAVYALHYRGYGGSEGAPHEAGLVADSLALYDHVQARHPAVTVVGRSLGSGVAVQLARARPVQRLVLVTPYHSLLGVAQHHYPYVPVRWLLRDRYESERHAAGLRVPTTVVLASHDEVIPRWSSDRLVAALDPSQTRVYVLPGTRHDDLSSAPGYVAALAGR